MTVPQGMLVAFARYSRDNSFTVLAANRTFVIVVAAGSIAGTLLGGLLLGVIPTPCSSRYSSRYCWPQPSKSGATPDLTWV